MTEVFKPRENMTFNEKFAYWECCDENDNFVCDGGPSVIWDDGKKWIFRYGTYMHRIDGPVCSSGEWYINNKDVTKEVYHFAKENDIDLDNLSDEDKVLIALKFG